MRKQWNFQTVSSEAVRSLQASLGISPILCQLLVQRGVTTYDQAKAFFRPQLQDLHDPFLMKNMSRAVARLERAIEQGEKILLYGDYDVDGTCSVALMHTFLKTYHKKLDFYIPDRYREGYGISAQGIEYAKENDVDLIIAMDCGVKAINEIALANRYKIDVIVCDHHLPGAQLPEAYAMLNPKQADCNYPYKELTGCGIAFKLAQAYQTRVAIDWDELANLLDLLVVSIGCDIVPITGENRVLAFYGLKKLNENPRLGLEVLMRASQQSIPMSIRDVVFGLGPWINAAGRLADATTAVQLLLAEDEKTAKLYCNTLEDRNQQRKVLEKQAVEEAKTQFTTLPDWENHKSMVLFQANWHKGILGIVAARMVDSFYHPSIILTQSGDKMVGSARSVRGFDIHKAISQCSDLLLNYGGHQYAAGLTLMPDKVDAFRERFEQIVQASIADTTARPQLDIAAEIDFVHITDSFWRILKQFAPFGPGNRNPIFVSRQVYATPQTRVVKEKHLKVAVFQHESPVFSGIGFGLGTHLEQIQEQTFSIGYNLNENTWKGKTTLQLNVKDIQL